MNTLSNKIACKRCNAAKEGIGFFLTKADVLQLLEEANISASDWKHDGYHLSRLNDIGDYVLGNCRFIPASQNYAEKVPTQRAREASRRNITASNQRRTPEERARIGRVISAALKGRPGHRKGGRLTSDNELIDAYASVSHLQRDCHFANKAAMILGFTSKHIRCLRKRWRALGLDA